ncbi:MAG: GyrI-like domain-containing protein [Flavitalea sp.]
MIYKEASSLIGLSLGHTTTNSNGQSSIDCGSLWKKFMEENTLVRIPRKINNDLFSMYHAYEGDHTKPYSFFIGCRVTPGTPVPEGMASLEIPACQFEKIVAKGKLPDCVANAWRNIWEGSMQRAYIVDYEIYDQRSLDWNNAEVDIFISVPNP